MFAPTLGRAPSCNTLTALTLIYIILLFIDVLFVFIMKKRHRLFTVNGQSKEERHMNLRPPSSGRPLVAARLSAQHSEGEWLGHLNATKERCQEDEEG